MPARSGAALYTVMLVGSPGLSSGRKEAGITKVWSFRVVLNITETEPWIRKSGLLGRPRLAPADTVKVPATPKLPPSRSVLMNSRPVAAP